MRVQTLTCSCRAHVLPLLTFCSQVHSRRVLSPVATALDAGSISSIASAQGWRAAWWPQSRLERVSCPSGTSCPLSLPRASAPLRSCSQSSRLCLLTVFPASSHSRCYGARCQGDRHCRAWPPSPPRAQSPGAAPDTGLLSPPPLPAHAAHTLRTPLPSTPLGSEGNLWDHLEDQFPASLCLRPRNLIAPCAPPGRVFLVPSQAGSGRHPKSPQILTGTTRPPLRPLCHGQVFNMNPHYSRPRFYIIFKILFV